MTFLFLSVGHSSDSGIYVMLGAKDLKDVFVRCIQNYSVFLVRAGLWSTINHYFN